MLNVINESEKTFRAGIYSFTVIVLAFFVLMFKIDGCSEKCKDSFTDFDSMYHAHCSAGAVGEIVSHPQTSKSGLLCKCNGSNK